MPLAGEIIEVGRIPGQRIATDIVTSDSPTFTTTETVVQSVTARLVAGRTYRVRSIARWETSVSGDIVEINIREDTVAGTVVQTGKIVIDTTSTTGQTSYTEGEFTATVTGNKTFVLTGDRTAGSGNINLSAGASNAAYLYVEYVSG